MQTMLLSKALTSRGALFKQQIYPDEGHNLGGVKQHLYRSMTLFFEDCFKKQVSMFQVSSFLIIIKYLQIPIEVKSGLGNGGTHEPAN